MIYQKITLLALALALAIMLLSTSIFAQPPIDQDVPSRLKDVVNNDDVIVIGSICVGFDCNNGESFGFDTYRAKENNLRFHFDDTSTSASFPNNDWRIVINDSSNGGANYFAVEDATAGRQPFRVEAGAPANSLYVEDGGRVGFGTSTPVVDLHVLSGNTPTLRLEQDGSSGFGTQTWDLAGNEANFFLRDASNGSTLPFRVFPGAPSNSLTIEASTGDVGLGTNTPDTDMHLRRTDASTTELRVENANATAQTVRLRLKSDDYQWLFTNNSTGDFRIRETVNTPGSSSQLIISNSLAASPNQATFLGDVSAPTINGVSDMRLKKDVQSYDEGLSIISKLSPIKYRYNGQAGISSKKLYHSISAQELQKVAPHLVGSYEYSEEDEEGNKINVERFLNYDLGGVVWTLVNAVNEQQTIIDDKDERITSLESQVEELNDMQQQIQTLTDQVNQLSELLAVGNSQDVHIRNNKVAQIGQNYPNPYSTETTIEYFLPLDANKAVIQFYDVSGKMLKQVPITQTGKGQINLKTSDLPLGQYSYSLVVDNQIIDTKQMIIAR